ncbi:MAG: hypothetical protein LBO67_05355 [Spirochaetaceae bacterium]|jgi:hypothetical protein|nr:hypothetical protein [Spirochaetaceae bacterium]
MTALACIVLTLLVPWTLSAQEVHIRTALNAPVVGGRVSIFLFIDYPSSQEVRISMPNLGTTLQLDRVNTELRRTLAVMPDKKGPFTAVEMVFIPQQAGTITVAPIEIILPGRSLFTEPVSFFIHGMPTLPAGPPVFRWENIPRSVRVGEKVAGILRVSGRFNGSLADTIWYTALPAQTIFEYHAPTDAERAAGIVARVVCIPLTETPLTIAARELPYEGQHLCIPGFTVPVIASAGAAEDIQAEPVSVAAPDPAIEGSYGSLPQYKNQWYFLIGITLLIVLMFFQKSRFQWLFLALCIGILLYSSIMLLNAPHTLELHAVAVYRIPDTAAQINTYFDDGQIVTVRSTHEEWLYVEAVDGRAGWIQKE